MKLLRATSVEMFSYLGEREKKNLQAVRMIQRVIKKKKKEAERGFHWESLKRLQRAELVFT